MRVPPKNVVCPRSSFWSSPILVLRTKKALSSMGTGETLAITSTDPGSLKDMQAFCKQTGHELVSSSTNQGEFEFLIRRA
ncbi:MAG: sulfurtransferase TusA family protein [Thiobacillus sp.]